MVVLETERLVLRQFTPDDSEFILRLLNEPSFIQNIGDKGVRTLDQATTYLVEGPIKSYELHGHGLYLVALKESFRPVGMCGLLRRDRFEEVDIGYAFLPEFWSQGFALESAKAVLTFGSHSPKRDKTIALVSPGNAESVTLLTKLGFSFSHHVQMQPDAPDSAVYVLHHEPFPPRYPSTIS